ncbi:carboxylesterase family protein [Labilibaculum manganireducens]|uniref:carboxylesterase/lipase family protein n=1 Tax=Labilibaculum manganireducens TaxID=1940525 RepID=UPI0029F51D20|nr:carboxylesterase family protein [Labilibaculum manganireducens]
MKNFNYFTALLLLFITGACSTLPPEQVKVEQGIVQGTMENELRVFKGIPFATPPVGELRWKSPQPAEKWKGIKQTTEYAPAPMQGVTPSSGISEDCLYLNVWTPAMSSDEKLPVLVWIYGGGFSFGTTNDPACNGENLAKKGVIVVSIAYRVGQLGFLAHPELSAESPNHVSGNYGLFDQIAGLKWIQKNIANFGGDPQKVTIFGESAGAISVSMLCASPLAKGLFKGAISQSGGSFGPKRSTTQPGENMKSLQLAESEGVEYMKNMGASSISDLRKLPAEKFIPKTWTLPGSWPIIDGYVIPDDQYKLYEAYKYNDVPVLIGYNSDEGASFSPGRTPEEYIASVKNRFGQFADTLLQVYPVGEHTVPKSARDISRDAAFGWHTWSWARLQSQTGKSNVYYYYFDQHPNYPKGSPQYGYGSPHGQDVRYAFMNLDSLNPNTTPSDFKLSEVMGTYWTNFTIYGNPNGKGVPEWPTFSNEHPNVMYLSGSKPFVGNVPSEKPLQVLNDYFKWRRTIEYK